MSYSRCKAQSPHHPGRAARLRQGSGAAGRSPPPGRAGMDEERGGASRGPATRLEKPVSGASSGCGETSLLAPASRPTNGPGGGRGSSGSCGEPSPPPTPSGNQGSFRRAMRSPGYRCGNTEAVSATSDPLPGRRWPALYF